MDSMDDFDFPAAVAFPNTANLPGRIFVNDGLEKTDWPRSVLEPMPLDQYPTSEGSSEEEGVIMLEDFDVFNGVSATGFGPGGADSAGVQFRVYDNEQATWPPTKKLVLKPPRGPPIIVIPRCKPRKRVTRACVELAISEWMERQRRLPDNERAHIEVEYVPYTVDGEVRRVAVWLWKGLQQVMEEPNTFKICLN